MKIKVTTTKPKEKQFFEGDAIPSGLYLDAERDLCLYIDPTDTFVFFYDDGSFDALIDPIWPLIAAPKGTKIEINV